MVAHEFLAATLAFSGGVPFLGFAFDFLDLEDFLSLGEFDVESVVENVVLMGLFDVRGMDFLEKGAFLQLHKGRFWVFEDGFGCDGTNGTGEEFLLLPVVYRHDGVPLHEEVGLLVNFVQSMPVFHGDGFVE